MPRLFTTLLALGLLTVASCEKEPDPMAEVKARLARRLASLQEEEKKIKKEMLDVSKLDPATLINLEHKMELLKSRLERTKTQLEALGGLPKAGDGGH